MIKWVLKNSLYAMVLPKYKANLGPARPLGGKTCCQALWPESSHGTHVVHGDNLFPLVALWPVCAHTCEWMCTYIHTTNKWKVFKNIPHKEAAAYFLNTSVPLFSSSGLEGHSSPLSYGCWRIGSYKAEALWRDLHMCIRFFANGLRLWLVLESPLLNYTLVQ